MVDLPIDGHLPSFDRAPMAQFDAADGRGTCAEKWSSLISGPTPASRLRTLGLPRARAANYKVQGFIVAGVHTPEFLFQPTSRTFARPRRTSELPIRSCPIPDYAIWRAFNHQYWLGLELYGEHVWPLAEPPVRDQARL
jgi:hypothetical protein